MVRGGCSPQEGLKRGAWTSQEDKLLSEYIAAHGLGRWRSLPKNAGARRSTLLFPFPSPTHLRSPAGSSSLCRVEQVPEELQAEVVELSAARN